MPETWLIQELPLRGTVNLQDLPEGDAELEYKIAVDDQAIPLARGKLGIAFVKDLEKRLEVLTAAIDDLPATAASVEEATLRAHVQLLKSLAGVYSPETDYPAAWLLKEAEAVLAARRGGEAYYGHGKTGQFWLTLLTGRTRTIVRLLAPPAAAKREPLPLVIALHGAGGSENMFFDVYGHGKIVELCQDRGWLLVAPRSGGFGGAPLAEVIDEIAKLYPVDSRRIFVVGHSMGAAQALLNARLTPERFTAIAALGGGRPIAVSEAMKTPAYFVGIGTKDFAYRGAKALGDALKKAQVPHFTYKEYPEVEHLMIVQISLNDVFRFFEEAAARRATKS
jgi:pimeloyl-ACP methyl ester carboxylesterase